MADVTALSQGDVLSPVVIARPSGTQPSPQPDRSAVPAPPAAQGGLRALGTFTPQPIPQVVTPGLSCDAVLVSQTCDVRKDSIRSVFVAPVCPMAFLSERDRGLCQANYFMQYLAVGELGAAYVDLGWLSTVEKGALCDAEVVGRVEEADMRLLNLKLSILLGRSALPDAVQADIALLHAGISGVSRAHRERLAGVFIRYSEGEVDLLIVLNSGTRAPSKIQKAFESWVAGEGSSPFRRTGRIAPAERVVFAELLGRQRLALDYLSFPVRREEG